MANFTHSQYPDSRSPRSPGPFTPHSDNQGTTERSYEALPGTSAHPDAGPSLANAPRRQIRAGDDVHYTTSPFEAPRDSTRPNEPGAPVDPSDKRGLFSRAAGTAILIASAVLAAAAVVLTALIHVHISIPMFLLAAGLLYAGRRMVRNSSKKVTEPARTDPGRQREPDWDD